MKRRFSLVILLLFFGISIGFAMLSASLSIGGFGRFKSNTWNIHFSNPVKETNDEYASVSLYDGAIDVNASLNKPGDTFTFTVDVVNDGTLDASYNSTELIGASLEVSRIIGLKVMYSENDELVEEGDVLESGDSVNLRIEVSYRDDIDGSYLLANGGSFNGMIEIVYSQSGIDYTKPEKVWVFEGNGYDEEFKVPYNGKYLLEVWGAQGGSYDSTYHGGYGGYSSGVATLNRNDRIYVVAGRSGYMCSGAEGTTCYADDTTAGMGENYSDSADDYTYVASGGGASFISDYPINRADPYNILIAAGGGGGAFYYPNNLSISSAGGNGGGYIGNSVTVNGTAAGGGQETQDSDNDFLQGASTPSFGSGAGGGFYGGLTVAYSAGAGGSGFLGYLANGIMYCYSCAESNVESTYTVSTTGTSELKDSINCPNGYSDDPISKCAKTGNGYVKITYIGG